MQRLIEFALCGSYSRDYDPYGVTGDAATQKILLAINSAPLSLREISAETSLSEQGVIRHLKALERCQLVKEIKKAGELYYRPSFAIFSLRDQKKLRPLIKKLGKSLVGIVEDSLPTINEELTKVRCVKEGYHFPDLEYIAIGAYTFDYGGLEVLKNEGFLTVTKEMPGGDYVFSGLEAGLIDLREAWMWGHNHKYGKYTFSTHGRLPPKGGRRAFPDLGFLWTYCAEDEEEKKRIEQKIVHYGDLLCELLKEPVTLDQLSKTLNRRKVELILDLTFLEELEYVASTIEQGKRKYVLNRPVLLLQDYKCIHKLSKRILMQFLDQSLRASYGELESPYKETSPAKNGIDMREAFNFVYHNTFEKALDQLIASKVIAEPPLRRDGGRYSSWVAIETGA
jgi:DNA-binding transcriptional regulator GbsR (MarR family)